MEFRDSAPAASPEAIASSSCRELPDRPAWKKPEQNTVDGCEIREKDQKNIFRDQKKHF